MPKVSPHNLNEVYPLPNGLIISTPPARKPPWEPPDEHTEQDVDNDTALQNYPQALCREISSAMEGSIRGLSSTGRFYRQIEPEPEFTTKIDKLKLARYLSGSPRRVLSKIVQLRSGHARLRQHYVGG